MTGYRWIKETRGEVVDPKAIWNASPTGELAHVFILYGEAKAYFERREAEAPK